MTPLALASPMCATATAYRSPTESAQTSDASYLATPSQRSKGLYFGYGSNVNSDFLCERLKDGDWVDDWHKDGRHRSRAPVDHGCFVLTDYAFSYNMNGKLFGEDYLGASVVPRPGCRTYGVLWDLAPEDIKKLDVDEKVPEAYARQLLPVTSVHEKTPRTVHAWVYVGQKAALTTEGVLSAAYVACIRTGAEKYAFPKEYVGTVIGARPA